MTRVTIRHVAEEAGYSVAAVSRYLNKQISLPEQTARRIEEAVAKLDYRPNALARRLTRDVTTSRY